MSLLNFLVKVYSENVAGPRERILSNTLATLSRQRIYIILVILSGMTVYSLYPCYDFLINGNLTLVSPLIIPYVDTTTLWGYFISTVSNVVCIAWSIAFQSSFSISLLVYVEVYSALVSFIEVDLKNFDNMWEIKEQGIINKRKLAFRNILIQLMDLSR